MLYKIYGDNKETSLLGRFPANLTHDGSEEVLELFPESKSGINNGNAKVGEQGTNIPLRRGTLTPRYDSGSAARFFYCAKASKKERGEGNNHPTVKPLALMRYLCKLITPKNGIILDPYCGSGTTGLAAKEEGFRYILIDKEEESVKIARNRIKQYVIQVNTR